MLHARAANPIEQKRATIRRLERALAEEEAALAAKASNPVARPSEITRILAESRQQTAEVNVKSQPVINGPLCSVLDDGAWKGERCFIIGGGESLKGFDFSRLAGELTIGVNRAYQVIDPTILFTMDSRFTDWARTGKIGGLEQWNSLGAVKVIWRARPATPIDGFYTVEAAKDDAFNPSIRKGLPRMNNSGFGAVALAIALGCSEIYLLGFDMRGGGNGKQVWWHDGYPSVQNSSVYVDMIEQFEQHAEAMKSRARIINCNPDSTLTCFEFGDLPPRVERKRGWQVISFYTKNTGYEKEIENLENSLKALKIPHHFFGFPETGSWRGNLNYKSQCILKAMDMFPDKDIVFLDSDAVVQRDPTLFDELSKSRAYDLSAHFFQYSQRSGGALELLSGTLWIANNETSRKLMQKWHAIGIVRDDVKHQQCLKLAIAALEKDGIKIRVNRHPFAYTCIFDYPLAKQCVPVIMHYQASRRLRKKVGYGSPLTAGE
jgi:hypothetical protein